MIVRELEKDDVETILDTLDLLDVFRFPDAQRSLGLNSVLTSQILEELVFFRLLTHTGNCYAVNRANVLLWKRYNREMDYRVMWQSDNNKTFFKEKGICVDVPTYEGKTEWDEEVE